MKINIMCKDHLKPKYMTNGSAGADLFADIEKEFIIKAGNHCMISTGVKIALPKGYFGEIKSRSGLAVKYGITVLTGTIDSDYRGIIHVVLINLGQNDFIIKPADRIAQILIKSVINADFEIVNELDSTIRNEGGFGHTGICVEKV